MYRRNLLERVVESVRFSPVTLINGARQTGKSTFLQTGFVTEQGFSYENLDDLNLLRWAKAEPITYLGQLGAKVAIDEIQRAPELMLPLKKIVDENRATKRFILTGSANVLTLPRLSESLAGRMEIHTLWPLSQGEIRGVKEQFIDLAFSDDVPRLPRAWSQAEYLDAIVLGGYPEALAQMQAGRGPEWFKAYLQTLLQRDIQEIARIEGLAELPHLLGLIAARAGNLINFADLARSARLNAMTLKRYYTLLTMVFLVVELPAWGGNHERRWVKSPKVMLNDSGLLCFLKGLDREALQRERGQLGGVLENFVAMECRKQAGWAKLAVQILHFRDSRGNETDIVLEAPDKRIVGLEVKASQDIHPTDFKGLRVLAAAAGERFHRGFLVYTGNEVRQYDTRLWAIPAASLWA